MWQQRFVLSWCKNISWRIMLRKISMLLIWADRNFIAFQIDDGKILWLSGNFLFNLLQGLVVQRMKFWWFFLRTIVTSIIHDNWFFIFRCELKHFLTYNFDKISLFYQISSDIKFNFLGFKKLIEINVA
mgnify:FL=1